MYGLCVEAKNKVIKLQAVFISTSILTRATHGLLS